jgi:hypothetical protein
VIPDEKLASSIPAVEPNQPYGFARQVDAALVRSRRTDETERFIFYRGLSCVAPPVDVTADSEGQVGLASGLGRVAVAFAVEMEPTQGRFARLGPVEPDKPAHANLGSRAFVPRQRVEEELATALEKELAAAGLNDDEARAMVQTWRKAWFRDPGTRVLYLVPREYVDRVLALDISPAPEQLARVFVGRLEYMTPAAQQRFAAAVKESASPDQERQRAALAELAARGRFLEASLRLVQNSDDRAVRRRARELLRQFAVTTTTTGK